jgi:hypothetical protein
MSSKNYLVYIAFGSDDFRNEALCSVLSYLLVRKPDEDTTVLIYTDNANHFQQLAEATAPIIYEEVEPTQWQQWRGEIDFVHRIKVEVLLHAVQKYGGNTLFLDSDTFFLQSPTPIFDALAAGQHFMHKYESTLSTSSGLHRTLYDILRQQPPTDWTSHLATTKMYNAGAIGLGATDIPLLERVLALTDSLYRIHSSHVMEQLSFSMCLAQTGLVQEVAPYVLHYWHMKDTRPVLAAFFAQHAGQPTPNILTALAQLPVVEAASQKDRWEEKKRWQRALLRAIGLGWKWPTAK